MNVLVSLLWVLGLAAPLQRVVDALSEKDCPRLHAMLTPAFQQKVPVAAMPGLCNTVGKLTSTELMSEDKGLAVVRATSASGVWKLELGIDGAGVSGLRVSPWPVQLQAKTLSAALAEVATAGHIPGMAALAMKDGKVIAQATYGVRKLGDPTPIGADDRWHLGSDTKAMTATLAALVVQDGKLSFSSTVGEVLSDWKDLDSAYAKVTLLQLLQHRGGVPGNVEPESWAALWKASDPVAGRAEFVHATLKQRAHQVGTYEYSNAGYMTAAVMVERVTGRTWDALMKSRVFEPLGMMSCGYGPSASPGKVDAPWSHELHEGVLRAVDAASGLADNPAGLGPAGTVHCSLADWGRFVEAHVRGERGAQTKLPLPASAWHALHTPNGAYALGWLVDARPWAHGPVLSHDGSNGMSYATVVASPADDRVFLVVANRGSDAATVATHAIVGFLSR